MIPINKVREIISRHKLLENKLSSDKIDKKNFDKTANDLEKILNDRNSDQEMKDLAKFELDDLLKKKRSKRKKIKIVFTSKG